jgi:hypothetical protein
VRSLDTDDEQACAVRSFGNPRRLRDDRLPRQDSNPCQSGLRYGLDRIRSDRRQVEAAVLARFRRFYENAFALRQADSTFPEQGGDVLEHAIRPIRGLDRKHAVCGDDDSLTDVEPTDRGNQRQSVLDVGDVARGRMVDAKRASPDENIGHEFVRRNHPELMRLEQARQPGQQVVVAAPEQPGDFRQEKNGQPVEPNIAKRWTHDTANENDIVATFRSGQTAKATGLSDA